jgi:DNA-binding transcriptional ArsR family regulator
VREASNVLLFVHGSARSVSSGECAGGWVSGVPGGQHRGGDVREHPAYRLKAELFRTLGHPARVRLLELLGEGERTVGALQDALELDSSGASQHLSALRRQGLLESRKLGTSVFCRVKDRRTLKLLAIAREILMANLEQSRILLGELDAETSGDSASTPVQAKLAEPRVQGRDR